MPAVPTNTPLIVAAGISADGLSFAVIRYLEADGSRDTSWGTGGLVDTSFGAGTSSLANGVAVQADGKVVAVGGSSDVNPLKFALTRYDTAGTLDTAFGTAGLVTLDFGGFGDTANGVAIQPDGKIVVAGLASDVALNNLFALCRLKTDGTLDGTFGTGGKVTTAFGGSFALGLALQGDGKVVACGASGGAFVVARYSALGVLDAGFGTAGLATPTIAGVSPGAAATAVTIQGDGKIVAAGYASFDGGHSYQFVVVRLGTNGVPDAGFGTAGVVTTDLSGGGVDQAYGLAIQADGFIVVVGQWDVLGYGLARYDTAGVLDPAFGTAGVVHTDNTVLGGFGDSLRSVAIQGNGKIIAAGTAAGQTKFGVARYLTDGTLDGTFGTGGLVKDAGGSTAYALAQQTIAPVPPPDAAHHGWRAAARQAWNLPLRY